MQKHNTNNIGLAHCCHLSFSVWGFTSALVPVFVIQDEHNFSLEEIEHELCRLVSKLNLRSKFMWREKASRSRVVLYKGDYPVAVVRLPAVTKERSFFGRSVTLSRAFTLFEVLVVTAVLMVMIITIHGVSTWLFGERPEHTPGEPLTSEQRLYVE